VVGDRDIFVVRHQRIFRPADGARGVRVVDAGEEIGEVADPNRQVQPATGGVMRKPAGNGADFPRIGSVGIQDVADPPTQRLPRGGTGFQQRVQVAPARRLGRLARGTGEQACFQGRADVEDLIADRDAAACRTALEAEHAERQVLDGKHRMAVGGRDPTGPAGGMSIVDHAPSPLFRQMDSLRVGGKTNSVVTRGGGVFGLLNSGVAAPVARECVPVLEVQREPGRTSVTTGGFMRWQRNIPCQHVEPVAVHPTSRGRP
jgi:hypothetical protein